MKCKLFVSLAIVIMAIMGCGNTKVLLTIDNHSGIDAGNVIVSINAFSISCGGVQGNQSLIITKEIEVADAYEIKISYDYQGVNLVHGCGSVSGKINGIEMKIGKNGNVSCRVH